MLSRRAMAMASWSSRVLPIPASPCTSTTRGWPAAASSNHRSSKASSCSRPTNGGPPLSALDAPSPRRGEVWLMERCRQDTSGRSQFKGGHQGREREDRGRVAVCQGAGSTVEAYPLCLHSSGQCPRRAHVAGEGTDVERST